MAHIFQVKGEGLSVSATDTAPVAVERGISSLIEDGIELAMESAVHDKIEFRHTLARASILSSVLFLEACANACIDALDLGRRFSDEIDRLSTAGKFDFFLRMRSKSKRLDRSRSEFQGYAELKNIRDSFVHPKAQKYDWIEWSEKSSISTSPRSPALGIAKIPAYCSTEDAAIALRAAHCFVSHVLKDCARLSSARVSAIFYSEALVPDLREDVVPCMSSRVRSWLEVNKIDISYMKVIWMDD